jgi:hypothetical protein
VKKIKKYLIKEEALESFDVIGICTAQTDFRLAWQLNSKFEIKLQKAEKTLEIPNKKSGDLELFDYYYFQDPEDLISYYLIKNKQNARFVLTEKQSIDYALVLHENHLVDGHELVDNLRDTDGIIAAFYFNSSEFSNESYLIFD